MGFFDRCRFGLFGVVFLSLSASTYAADYTVTAEAGSFYTRNVTPAGSVRSQTTFAARAMVPAGPVVYTTRAVVQSPATAAKLLRFAASPAGLVTATLITEFFDWFEQQGGQFDANGAPLAPPQFGECNGSTSYTVSVYGCNAGGGTDITALVSTAKACLADDNTPRYLNAVWLTDTRVYGTVFHTHLGYATNVQIGNVSGGSCRPASGQTSDQWDTSGDASPPVSWAPYVLPSHVVGDPGVMADSEFWDEFLASPYGDSSPHIEDVFEDQYGRPWNTAEIDAMRKAIRDELAAQDGTDPATLPDPSGGTSADPSNPDAPESQPDGWSAEAPSSGGGSQTTTEVPAFCEWAQIVCDWIGWTQDDAISPDPDPDMPFVELPQPAEWDSGFGSGTCPPPIVVPVFSSQVEIPWQPACDLAVMLRPLLLAIAGLSAALILLGQRAGGSGS